MKPVMRAASLVLATALIAVLGHVGAALGGAQLIPEIQQRLGTCPDGSACLYDCTGSQCDFGFGQQLCSENGECGISCKPGPVCDDGKHRTACTLPSLGGFTGRLVVRVDENDDLCVPPGTGCNQTAAEECSGSRVTIGLRGRKQDGSEFVIRKDVNGCAGIPPCGQDLDNDTFWDRDCNQCSDGFLSNLDCPRVDPILFCHGQENTEFKEFELDTQLEIWLQDIQPIEFLRADLPVDLQVGVPVIASAAQSGVGQFCSGTMPRATCLDDTDCPSGESCYAEAEFCVTVGLVRGRCLGGADAGELCSGDAECDSDTCGFPSVPDISGLLSDDTDIALNTLAPCGACPAAVDPTCETAFDKCQLQVNESTPGKEQVIAKWLKGPQFTGADVGNPLSGGWSAYNLCLYNEAGALAGDYLIDRAGATCGTSPCWAKVGKAPPDPGHKGYRYKDATTTSDGMLLLLLKGGEAGKSKIVAKGKNNAAKGQTSLPTGAATLLSGSTQATIALHGSDARKCFSCALTTVTKDADGTFKAQK